MYVIKSKIKSPGKRVPRLVPDELFDYFSTVSFSRVSLSRIPNATSINS